MNSEIHGTIRLFLYETVFNQHVRMDNWIPMEEREQAILHIAQNDH